MSASKLAIPRLTAQATEGGVLLTWGAVPLAVRYELAVWWDPGTGWQSLGGDSLTAITYTHKDVTAGTTYYYSVRALNSAGEAGGWLLDYPYATALQATVGATSTPTPTSRATPTPSQTPTSTPTATASAPELTIPQLTAQARESGVLLSWEAVSHMVRYELAVWWDRGSAGNCWAGTA